MIDILIAYRKLGFDKVSNICNSSKDDFFVPVQ